MDGNVVVGKPMTARAFLATAQGQQLSAGVRGPIRTQGIFGDIGTVLDLVKLIGGMTGTGPGMDIEELLRDHRELLDQILASQGDVLDGIGGVGDQLGGIADGVSGIADLIEQLQRAEDEGRAEDAAEMKGLLEQMLLEQRQATETINRNIAAVSGQVAGLWADMNSWFADTLGQIDSLSKQLDVIQEKLAVLEALLHTVLAELAELHDRVDWTSIITLIAEHEHRVSYCNATALEIAVTPVAQSETPGTSPIRVDTDGLREWARSVADEVNGLPYSLFAMHRVMIGDSLLGRPLMDVFCRLMSHNSAISHVHAAQYFVKLAATQAQGYAILAKARQALALPPVDFETLYGERLAAQVETVKRALKDVYNASEWNDGMVPDRITPYKVSMDDFDEEPKSDYLYVVDGNRWVITSTYAANASRPEFESWIGNPVPGSRSIDPASIGAARLPSSESRFEDVTTVVVKEHPTTGKPWRFLSYYPLTYIFDTEYVMVGLKVSNVERAMLFEPLVALYDPETGTTSWDPASGSGLWKVTPDELGEPHKLDLGNAEDETVRGGHQKYMNIRRVAGDAGPLDPAMITGFRVTTWVETGAAVWFRMGYLDDNWEKTMLPRLTGGDKFHYEPFTP